MCLALMFFKANSDQRLRPPPPRPPPPRLRPPPRLADLPPPRLRLEELLDDLDLDWLERLDRPR